MAVAPTRSGKTTRVVVPALLEHRGPAIVLLNKTDIVFDTVKEREKRGPVWVCAPFTSELPHRCGWTPLDGCESWEYALRMGRWLFDADPTISQGVQDSGGARFYNREAVGVALPPLRGETIAVDEQDGSLRARLDGSDRELSIGPEDADALRLGYASHVYRQQGATVDRAIVVTGGWETSRESAYVEASRARESVEWHVARDQLGRADDAEGVDQLAALMRVERAQTPSLAHDLASDDRDGGTERSPEPEPERAVVKAAVDCPVTRPAAKFERVAVSLSRGERDALRELAARRSEPEATTAARLVRGACGCEGAPRCATQAPARPGLCFGVDPGERVGATDRGVASCEAPAGSRWRSSRALSVDLRDTVMPNPGDRAAAERARRIERMARPARHRRACRPTRRADVQRRARAHGPLARGASPQAALRLSRSCDSGTQCIWSVRAIRSRRACSCWRSPKSGRQREGIHQKG